MWLLRDTADNVYVATVLALMIALLGVVTLWALLIDILPVFPASAVRVLAVFNGLPDGSAAKIMADRSRGHYSA